MSLSSTYSALGRFPSGRRKAGFARLAKTPTCLTRAFMDWLAGAARCRPRRTLE
jgi:hypothetical protein